LASMPDGIRPNSGVSCRTPEVGEGVSLHFTDVNGDNVISSGVVAGKVTMEDSSYAKSIDLYSYSGSSVDGACGGVYLAHSDGKIVGIHGIGSSSSSANVLFWPIGENFNSKIQQKGSCHIFDPLKQSEIKLTNNIKQENNSVVNSPQIKKT